MNPRVLFVSHTARWAGPTNSLLLLLRELRGRLEMRVLIPGEGDFAQTLAEEGVQFSSVPTLSKKAIPGIVRLIRSQSIDLVYGNNTSGACRNALIAAKLARVPFICHIREMGRVERRRHLSFLRFADAMVAVSAACAASVPDFRGRTLHVVHNGIPTPAPPVEKEIARSHVDATTGTLPNVPVIACVAHLHPRKGQEHAIRALARLVGNGIDAQLLLIGSTDSDVSYLNRLRQVIIDLKLGSRVTVAGFRRDVLLLLQGSDLFLHTATADPHPRAVIEAMGAGLPVVAFAVDGVAETVVSGETGELVAIGDVVGLAAAAGRILRDPGLAAEFGARARERVTRHFSSEQTASAVGAIIERTLARGSGTGKDRRERDRLAPTKGSTWV